MNVLIICTYYPPDIAIAGVRPYMLAKYLTRLGHNVTVIRSGTFFNKPDKSFIDEKLNVNVYSYLGENSPAERFLRGEYGDNDSELPQKKLNFLPEIIRAPLSFLYRGFTFPLKILKYLRRTKAKFNKQKLLIDTLDESFDVVFATYSDLENVYAGAYAAQKFNCKYILDLRDLMAQKGIQKWLDYVIKLSIQKKAVQRADVCTTVSDGLSEAIKKYVPNKKVITLYNGYERKEDLIGAHFEDEKFHFCYTGTLYGNRSDATPIFSVLKQLSDNGKIDINNIKFDYAGNGFEQILIQASEYGMADILVNHGYVSKAESDRLQNSADLFVVLSWNTKHIQGVLTGKFYEALKNFKPVIASVSGMVANSELRKIIEKYNLGICYEEADSNFTENELYNYILSQYNRKMNGENVLYTPAEEVFEKFEYSGIAKEMEKIMKELIEKNTEEVNI